MATIDLGQMRKRAGAFLIDGFFRGASRMGRMHPRARPERHGVELLRDIEYARSGRREHKLDVYRPIERKGPLPIVLYVHGGGFRVMSKDTHWIMGLRYARSGYVVFMVGYRLAPAHPFPAAAEDVATALPFVLANAARYGGDPTRVIFAGESAGANLVTGLALSTVYPRSEPFARAIYDTGLVPRAVVPACGIFQVSDTARLIRRKPTLHPFIVDRLEEVEQSYVGKDAARYGALLDFADPVCWAERGERPARPLPPFFLPVGTKDPVLPDTRRLARAIEKLGGIAVDRYYEGEVHAFHAFPFLANTRRCWKDTFDFLEAHTAREPSTIFADRAS
jgi:acetyl esterase